MGGVPRVKGLEREFCKAEVGGSSTDTCWGGEVGFSWAGNTGRVWSWVGAWKWTCLGGVMKGLG